MAGDDENVDLVARGAAQQREKATRDAEEAAIRDAQRMYEEERAGGPLMKKTPEEIVIILDKLSEDANQWPLRVLKEKERLVFTKLMVTYLCRSAFINASLCQILEGDPYKEEEHRRDLSGKCGDPGSFTIPCSLGAIKFDKSLCDFGSSINLIPLSIYKKLENEIGEIRSAPISLQLANQTTLILEGIMEDVLVWVDKFVFHVDFTVMNMEENKEIPLILGRPFLATGRVILDINERRLMLRVGEKTVTFEMNVETGVKKEK
ncbi:uncharacterized protein [Nicotiana tomentosiformis]|uniref:uncharacterized protein n=1 Tax=Nicotiana tomentosiformis TaxID=4098 RepID=UPI00388C7319